jgi:solute:Na+ symporter, SSS family
MNGQLRTIDLGVLLVYMAAVFGLGCWFSRKSSNTSEFMTAGRSLPGWAVGLSVFGTYVSSIGFLGNTGKAFGSNWNSWVFGLSLPLAAIIAVRYFVPLYRQGNEVSAYAHLEKRFGPWARTYALLCYLLSQLARCGTILYLVALALAPLTGWDIKTIIVVTGVLVTTYTLLGGIEAVIWTDVVQSVVLIAGALLCAGLLLLEMPGGADELFRIANEDGKFSLGSFSLDPATVTAPDPTFWIVLVYGLFINLQNFGIDQSFVQRYLTARTDEGAKRSVWMASIMFPLVSILFFLIGSGLYSFARADSQFQQDVEQMRADVAETRLRDQGIDPTPENIAAETAYVSDAAIGDKVLPHFIVNKLPLGMAGLLIAAIFAAAMSSMDTSLNSSATLWLCDVHRRYLRPDAGERESMIVLYAGTLVVGVIATVTALAMIRVKSALDMWWNLQGIFTGGMLGVFLLGLISKRAGNPAAALGVVAGVLMTLWLSLSTTEMWPQAWRSWSNPLHNFLTIIIGTSTIVIVGMLVGVFLAGHSGGSSNGERQASAC